MLKIIYEFATGEIKYDFFIKIIVLNCSENHICVVFCLNRFI